MNIKNHKIAFTLAEVLITLGIIGIVAALTMPTLMANYRKQVTVNRLKSAYSQLYQAIKLSEVENGPLKDWDTFSGYDIKTSSRLYTDKYIKPYFKSMNPCPESNKNCGGGGIGVNSYNTVLNNGVGIAVQIENHSKLYMIDVNGVKSNKKMGKDTFYFSMNEKLGLMPYGWKENLTRNEIINGYSDGLYNCACNKQTNTDVNLNSHACTALIYFDGWEIKNDYPIKF